MDYRNNNLNGKNTIIYGHGRLDKTMFGSLKNVLNDRWYNNVDNYIIKLSTEEKDCVYQVFSVYKIPTTNDYIQTSFTDEQYDEFLTKIKNRSIYKFYNEISSNDKILTLSTCYSNSEKLVVHAKLIKETSRNN